MCGTNRSYGRFSAAGLGSGGGTDTGLLRGEGVDAVVFSGETGAGTALAAAGDGRAASENMNAPLRTVRKLYESTELGVADAE